jgi:hypothetical protein
MPKRPSTDPNLFAKSVFDKLLAKYDPDSVPEAPLKEAPQPKQKNPVAVALGLKGGKIRAQNLSAKRRSQIARKAAKARWKKS